MSKSGAQQDESPSRAVDERIEEPGDWLKYVERKGKE